MLLTCIRGIPLASSPQYTQTYTQAISSVRVNQFKFVFSGQCLLLGGAVTENPAAMAWVRSMTSHNLWLLNLEPCTLHSSPPAPPNPTQLLGGGKDYQRKLQRVRTSTSTIGVPDAGSNCYLHKGHQHLVLLVL